MEERVLGWKQRESHARAMIDDAVNLDKHMSVENEFMCKLDNLLASVRPTEPTEEEIRELQQSRILWASHMTEVTIRTIHLSQIVHSPRKEGDKVTIGIAFPVLCLDELFHKMDIPRKPNHHFLSHVEGPIVTRDVRVYRYQRPTTCALCKRTIDKTELTSKGGLNRDGKPCGKHLCHPACLALCMTQYPVDMEIACTTCNV
jgi:hypothetical protein